MRALLGFMALGIAGAAWGDVVGPGPGNELNPKGINPATYARPRDPEGLGQREPAAHSPTGRLYDRPPVAGEEAEPTDGWVTNGFVEAGILGLHGDKRSQGFLNYKDVKDGPYVNAFALTGERRGEARFFEATGGALGMDDQFYRLQGGRYNDWKVTAFYDGLPHVYTSSFKSLWGGIGTGTLTLAGLTPAGTANAATTQTNVRNALAATEESTLETIRKKAGVRFDKRLTSEWSLYAAFTDEQRDGAKPLGAVFGNANLFVAEPIDYTTRDIAAGVQYNDTVSSFNLRASASFFHNAIDTLTFQNPLFVTPSGSTGLPSSRFTQGRFDLVPDNQHYNLKGEYARNLPFWRGNVTATAAVGTMRQDDPLIPSTTLDMSGGTVTAGGSSLAAGRWNTTDSLSRQNADTRLDTRLADLRLTLRPMDPLDVRGELRYYETRNLSQYVACNPLTGQFGRLISDGAGISFAGANTIARANPPGTSANAFNTVGCDLDAARALNLAPAAGNVPIASVPYDHRSLNGTVSGDYRVGRASSINAALERETIDRDFRERAQTWEDRLKLGYVDRGLIEGSVRFDYEHSRRSGDTYVLNPYTDYRSIGLGPVPTDGAVPMASWLMTISQFRKFDIADRTQDSLGARVDYAVRPDMDLAGTMRLKDALYPAEYGRNGHQRSGSATVDLSWHIATAGTFYGFYAFDASRLHERGIQPDSCTLGNTYYFFSDGRVASAAAGAPPPATPPGTTLIGTRTLTGANWMDACGTASATSPLFTTSRTWDVTSQDRTHTLGFGLRWDFGRARLDTNFSRALGRTHIAYGYDATAFNLSAQQVALAGTSLPDMTFSQNVFDASLLVPLRPELSMRLLARYEAGRVRDWHYDGLADNPMPTATSLYLDSGPRDYRTTLLGLFFLLRL